MSGDEFGVDWGDGAWEFVEDVTFGPCGACGQPSTCWPAWEQAPLCADCYAVAFAAWRARLVARAGLANDDDDDLAGVPL